MSKKYLDYDGVLYFWQKIKALFVSGVSYNSTNKKIQVTKNGSISDVVTLATVATSGSYSDLSNKPTIPEGVEKTSTTPKMDGTAAVGSETKFAAGDHVHPTDTSRVPTTRKVNDKALTADITLTASDVSAVPTTRKVNNKALSSDITLSASDVSAVASSAVGAASGVCPLNSNGVIDSTYIPGMYDDVLEAYPVSGATELSAGWLSATSGGSALTPQTGIIYILMSDTTSYSANSQFRWSGSTYVKLADGGVTSITNAEIDTIVAS